jgi:outer membrane protein assembly factor BamB
LLFKFAVPDPQLTPAAFGAAVAMDGNIALVGAYGTGAAYAFDMDTGQVISKFTPSDPGMYSDWFGSSVAISGNSVLVGARHQRVSTGAVYVFSIPEPASFGLLGFACVGYMIEARGRSNSKRTATRRAG